METISKNRHFISLKAAKGMTKKFRDNRKNLVDPKYKDKDILPTCETFDRSAFDAILARPGCEGIRIYFGQGEQDEIRLVIVGVDAKGCDLIVSAAAPLSGEGMSTTGTPAISTLESTEEDSGIIENGTRCPTDCPASSELNS